MNIIFDLGEVLLKWDPFSYYIKMTGCKKKTKWLFDNIFTSEWRNRSDLYVTVSENVRILSIREPKYRNYIEKWDADFFKIMDEEIADNVDIAVRLIERGHKVYAISNFASDKYCEAFKKFSVLQKIDGVVVSSNNDLVG